MEGVHYRINSPISPPNILISILHRPLLLQHGHPSVYRKHRFTACLRLGISLHCCYVDARFLCALPIQNTCPCSNRRPATQPDSSVSCSRPQVIQSRSSLVAGLHRAAPQDYHQARSISIPPPRSVEAIYAFGCGSQLPLFTERCR